MRMPGILPQRIALLQDESRLMCSIQVCGEAALTGSIQATGRRAAEPQ
jgi:hypothetical protein